MPGHSPGYYNIKVSDRIALGANIDFLSTLNLAGGGADYASVGAALTALGNAGTIDRQAFVGLEDLKQFRSSLMVLVRLPVLT